MARPIVLSNGELHVGLNRYGLVHDFYFPYVGLENHSAGDHTRHRIGIWVDGELSWLDTPGEWIMSFRYPHQALIGHIIARNARLNILLEFDDFVDSEMSAFIRNIHVINQAERPREIRLFMHQSFVIGDSRSNTDTAQYLPDSEAILHYRGRRAFVISGEHRGERFDQHSIGLFGIEGHEGTYRDADDGELSGSNVEHGRVDSVIRFKLRVRAQSSERVHYWIAAGTSMREALFVEKHIRRDGVVKRLFKTAKWWEEWLEPALQAAKKVDKRYQDSFIRSVMIIKSQIDKRGAVIASTDSSMLNYSRDNYAYCWPRDGAFVIWPLIRMGYIEEAYRFFEFCRRGMHPAGYLMHKYRADGGLGSSWHPYDHGDIIAPPIQVDETALTVFVMAQFYQTNQDPKFLSGFYESMIKPMANFLSEYIDEATGLPKPSYDLWENEFLTTTYTVATVFASLQAAAELADVVKDEDMAVHWRAVAEDIHEAAHKHLYNEERKAFYKGIIIHDGKIEKDGALDISSLFGVFMFGLYPVTSPEFEAAVETYTSVLMVGGTVGMPRFENDNYRETQGAPMGNWWFITTLWMAQYHIDRGHMDKAKDILDWVNNHTPKTDMLSEQINPLDGTQISPSPLTWSQAEYVATLLDTISDIGAHNG
jgi:GH15 family glucan-1,4-alpha-glucosidase